MRRRRRPAAAGRAGQGSQDRAGPSGRGTAARTGGDAAAGTGRARRYPRDRRGSTSGLDLCQCANRLACRGRGPHDGRARRSCHAPVPTMTPQGAFDGTPQLRCAQPPFSAPRRPRRRRHRGPGCRPLARRCRPGRHPARRTSCGHGRLPVSHLGAGQHRELHRLQPADQLPDPDGGHPRHPGDLRRHHLALPGPGPRRRVPLRRPVRRRRHRPVRARARHRLARGQLGLQHPQHRHRARGLGGPAVLLHHRDVPRLRRADRGDLRQVRHPQGPQPHHRPLPGARHRPHRPGAELGLGALHAAGQRRLTA
ncbi:hypothetical protein SBRY_30601 [Actinacidiphila bryophytorum]|uniref:Uncharacterized protein n=1 Tax=Actinacidiphila bryophytorum TaxID=1436133 RepID=A0A9W4M9V9_9ACTN|nr:hypothetical protein SBRY_30601 [Actinacidiphila bryophytorum]